MYIPPTSAPVAQLDRVTVSEAVGHAFESRLVYHKKSHLPMRLFMYNYASI